MRICFVSEGCYPYVTGGVSSWIDSMIKTFPEHEFVLLSVIADRSKRGKFVYKLPENVTEVYEVYLNDVDWTGGAGRNRRFRLKPKEYEAMRSLLLNLNVDWETIFDLFHDRRPSLNSLLMGPDFLRICTELYDRRYPDIAFSDFLWTNRSIYLPLFQTMNSDLPKADLYHCVSTGYCGVIGCMAAYLNKGRLVLSEHGIYTREREEDLIRAKWVQGVYKEIWIEQFRKISQLIYDRAEVVTSLFGHARELQIELGCPAEKTRVIPNAINIDKFKDLPGRLPEDDGYVNIGAVLRIAPIKDVKTLINAFAFAKARDSRLKLWLMGPGEDPKYEKECHEIVETLKLKDCIFTGRVNVHDYLGRMDFLVLTSISEGQPLTILEGFAAHKPSIATDVGCCRELLYGGEGDHFGTAGILTHIMNIQEIATAMLDLAASPERTKAYGENGYRRACEYYRLPLLKESYRQIYDNDSKKEQ